MQKLFGLIVVLMFVFLGSTNVKAQEITPSPSAKATVTARPKVISTATVAAESSASATPSALPTVSPSPVVTPVATMQPAVATSTVQPPANHDIFWGIISGSLALMVVGLLAKLVQARRLKH